MRKCLLDSDILSEVSKGIDRTVLANAAHYLDEHGIFTFTSVSVYEGLYGIKAKPAPQQAIRFLQLIAVHEEIVPDKGDYRVAADMRAALHLAGTEIGKADPLIAACAFQRGLVMVTGNKKHYQFIVNAGFSFTISNWRER